MTATATSTGSDKLRSALHDSFNEAVRDDPTFVTENPGYSDSLKNDDLPPIPSKTGE